MITFDMFRQMALSFADTDEHAHFEKLSFRVHKKIFATFDGKKNQACLRLPEIDQSVFSTFCPTAIFPVPNSWGKQGWTVFNLADVAEDLFTDALTIAYKTRAH